MTKKLILDLDTGIDDASRSPMRSAVPRPSSSASPPHTAMSSWRTRCAIPWPSSTFWEPTPCRCIRVCRTPPLPRTSPSRRSPPSLHGRNGLGEADIAPSTRSAAATDAVDLLIEASRQYGEELVYVPTGPLTNLAAALDQDPGLVERLDVVLMGGALSVSGNVNPWAEANISQDPDAADTVFRSGVSTTMIGLDVTLQTLLTYEHTRRWREPGTPAGTFLADMTDYYIRAYETTAPGLGGCGLHDPLAVGVAIDPSLVTAFPINLQVDLDGPTRGRTIGDVTRLNEPWKNSRVALAVDVERFLAEFMSRTISLVQGP